MVQQKWGAGAPHDQMKNEHTNSNTPTEKCEDSVLMDNGTRFYFWVIGIAPSSQVHSNGGGPSSKH